MKKYKKILLVVLLCLFGFTSCQATPEHEIVVNKGNSDLMDKINTIQETDYHYDFPEKWETNISGYGDRLTIHVNGTIIVPEINRFPVIMVEPESFQEENIMQLANEFFPSCNMVAAGVESELTKKISKI